jgi:hypothetical protein
MILETLKGKWNHNGSAADMDELANLIPVPSSNFPDGHRLIEELPATRRSPAG